MLQGPLLLHLGLLENYPILIDILGLKRELAKALIIDSAREWNEKPAMDEISIYGHGVVPIRIEDIIYTPDDEIRFLVSDISEKWNTYNYDFPIPYISDNDIKKHTKISSEEISDGRKYSLLFIYGKVVVSC